MIAPEMTPSLAGLPDRVRTPQGWHRISEGPGDLSQAPRRSRIGKPRDLFIRPSSLLARMGREARRAPSSGACGFRRRKQNARL
jgi:hypothetical protein